MLDINKKIDEYFYPQSNILKHFNVPKKFYCYTIEDFREYFWNIDKSNKQINIGSRFRNGLLFGSFGKRIIDIDGLFSCDNIKTILVVNPLVEYSKSFLLLDSYKELILEQGKYHLKEQKIGIGIYMG